MIGDIVYKKIISYGCSYTEGLGLHDMENSSWPALIAKHLNVPLDNRAKRGISNDSILRRILETDVNDFEDALVLILWTHTDRREIYQNDEFLALGEWLVVHDGFEARLKLLGKCHYMFFNSFEENLVNAYRNLHHAQSYLKSLNIKYYMGIVTDHDFIREEEYKKVFNYDLIDWSRMFYRSHYEYAMEYTSTLDYGHANEHGHYLYANDFIKHFGINRNNINL